MKIIFRTGAPLIVLIVVASLTLASDTAEISGSRPHPDGQPTEIQAAVYLIDVSQIDGARQEFTADVFLLLSWNDPRLADGSAGVRRIPVDEVWNPRIQILNRRGVSIGFPELVDVDPDGTVTLRQRYFGQYAEPLDLREFPLDRHTFAVRLVVPGYSPEEVRLVADPRFSGGPPPRYSIPDWSVSPTRLRPEPFAVIPGGPQIAGMVAEFDARRHLGFYVGKAFVSVAIIVFMSWIVFWIDPQAVAPRISVSVTSMLTLIAYRFLLGQELPKVSYLTRLDYFLLGTTILVFLSLIQVAWTSALFGRGRAEAARRIDRWSRWLFPSMFFALSVISFWL
jgi:hypothetical protein